MKCFRCAEENPPQAKFCLDCGAPAGTAATAGASYVELQDENERLRRSQAESAEQQAASAEILRLISRSPSDIQPVFEALLQWAVRLCAAEHAALFRFDASQIHLVAAHGFPPDDLASISREYPMAPTRSKLSGRAILSREVAQVGDIFADPDYRPTQQALVSGFRSILAVPMLRSGEPVGAILIYRREVGLFPDKQVTLLQTFADQAVIAIENVRLFTELQEKNQALTQAHAQVSESLEQQTATSDILRVISSSPTNVQPVFEAIGESAVRLMGAAMASVYEFDGTLVHLRTLTPPTWPHAEELRRQYPKPPDTKLAAGRVILARAILHLADLATDPGTPSVTRQIAERMGLKGVLWVPMLREGTPIGVIGAVRAEAGLFSDKQVRLLQIFADQAVIAIENVRLFTELQEKNQALTQAHAQITQNLDQQTATSEILKVISRLPTEVQPVFETIVRNAARLCRAATATVLRTDGTMLYLPANYGATPEVLAAARALFPRPLDMTTASGAAILTRSVVQIPDSEDAAASDFVRQSGRLVGYRSSLAVPMLRGAEAIGAIRVTRREPSQFSDADVELLKTFADQAVIAIENLRLFNELEAANRDLKAASQHKSEFLANMSHELRTPLNAIIGFSEVLGERMFGELNEKQDEYLKDIHASGQHLLSLINDILDLSKIEAGRMELQVTDFDLPLVIDNALTLVRERAARRSIALHTTVDERLGQIQGDERKIRQVLLNLLSNAIKFTPEGGRIEVRAKHVDGSVEIVVADTGVGIAPEDQEAIFEEFRQVGIADKKVEGTGLGLALSRKFIELHGGKIWVKSQIGEGSTFIFTVPVRRGEEPHRP